MSYTDRNTGSNVTLGQKCHAYVFSRPRHPKERSAPRMAQILHTNQQKVKYLLPLTCNK